MHFLIEGPPYATDLIPLAAHAEFEPPGRDPRLPARQAPARGLLILSVADFSPNASDAVRTGASLPVPSSIYPRHQLVGTRARETGPVSLNCCWSSEDFNRQIPHPSTTQHTKRRKSALPAPADAPSVRRDNPLSGWPRKKKKGAVMTMANGGGASVEYRRRRP